MKKLFYILAIIVGSISMSCSDFLEVTPISDVSGDKFWTGEQQLSGGLHGVYDGYQGLFIRGDKYWDWGEGRSDNVIPRDDATYLINLTNNVLTPDGGYGDFSTLYTIIGRANTFLENYEKAEGISEEVTNNYVGQVLVLRALAYFYAVRTWGDVPFITKAITSPFDDNLYPVRENKEKIYTELILPDLERATTLLSKNNKNKLINYYGALAVLMDVYMWRHQYDDAIATFNKFENEYSLVPGDKWSKLFTDAHGSGSAKENIFAIEWAGLTDGRSGLYNNFMYGNPSFHVSGKWTDILEDGDIRIWNTIDTTYVDWRDGGRNSWKYFGPEPEELATPEEGDYDIPIYRWADMLLLYAEALNEKGQMPEAIAEMNKVRVRAGLPLKLISDFANKDEVLDAILKERQIELYAEAKRWYDLVRTGKVFDVMNPIYDFPLQPGELLWPIDENDLAENPNLEQNEAYK